MAPGAKNERHPKSPVASGGCFANTEPCTTLGAPISIDFAFRDRGPWQTLRIRRYPDPGNSSETEVLHQFWGAAEGQTEISAGCLDKLAPFARRHHHKM